MSNKNNEEIYDVFAGDDLLREELGEGVETYKANARPPKGNWPKHILEAAKESRQAQQANEGVLGKPKSPSLETFFTKAN